MKEFKFQQSSFGLDLIRGYDLRDIHYLLSMALALQASWVFSNT
jgi:hypothetical protein